jgi:hypothetical protein
LSNLSLSKRKAVKAGYRIENENQSFFRKLSVAVIRPFGAVVSFSYLPIIFFGANMRECGRTPLHRAHINLLFGLPQLGIRFALLVLLRLPNRSVCTIHFAMEKER